MKLASLARARSGAWVATLLAVAVGLIAYRPLVQDAFPNMPGLRILEMWLFRPSQLPGLLVIGVASWMIWRRRQQLRALPLRRSSIATVVLAALGAGLYVWACLTRTADLLLPSLSAGMLAFGCAWRGLPGLRALLAPAAVLLLGVPIPAPLRHEIIWRLQLATAAGASWILDLAGQNFELDGVVLKNGDQSFHVIDGCCGLQGILILILTAVIVRDLHDRSTLRSWLPLLVAAPLGYALNVLRVSVIAASSEPAALTGLGVDHTPQGLAVLAAGAGILYATGRWGTPRATRRPATPRPTHPTPTSAAWAVAAGFAVLAATSALLPRFPEAEAQSSTLHFPDHGFGWVSEDLPPDPYFAGTFPRGNVIYRRYELAGNDPPWAVELFALQEPDAPFDSASLFSSKLSWPGPEWTVLERERSRLWVLDRDAIFALAAPGQRPSRAVVYTWRLRDEGIWCESWRSLLALEASPLRRATPRAVVQLVAFSRSGEPLDLARARRRLDHFITHFREAFAAL